MAFPLGVLLTWLGIAGLWVSFHRTGATTPWGVYQEILGKGTDAAPAASDGTKPAQSDPSTDPASPSTTPPAATGGGLPTPTLGGLYDAFAGPNGLLNSNGFTQPMGSGGVTRYGGQ